MKEVIIMVRHQQRPQQRNKKMDTSRHDEDDKKKTIVTIFEIIILIQKNNKKMKRKNHLKKKKMMMWTYHLKNREREMERINPFHQTIVLQCHRWALQSFGWFKWLHKLCRTFLMRWRSNYWLLIPIIQQWQSNHPSTFQHHRPNQFKLHLKLAKTQIQTSW